MRINTFLLLKSIKSSSKRKSVILTANLSQKKNNPPKIPAVFLPNNILSSTTLAKAHLSALNTHNF
jgi:hypothetical protein